MVLKKDMFTRCQSIKGVMYLAKDGNAYKLNEMGLKIWNLIDGKKELDDIINIILEEFQQERIIVERDVITFLKALEKRKLILPM